MKQYYKVLDENGVIVFGYELKWREDIPCKEHGYANDLVKLRGLTKFKATFEEVKDIIEKKKRPNSIGCQRLIPGLTNPTKTKGIASNE